MKLLTRNQTDSCFITQTTQNVTCDYKPETGTLGYMAGIQIMDESKNVFQLIAEKLCRQLLDDKFSQPSCVYSLNSPAPVFIF